MSKAKFYVSASTLLIVLHASPVFSEDHCQYTMRKQDKKCSPTSWALDKVEKCHEAINNVSTACFTNNPWRAQADNAKQAIREKLDSKASIISDPAQYELAQTVSEMAILNDRIKVSITALSQAKQEIAATLCTGQAKPDTFF